MVSLRVGLVNYLFSAENSESVGLNTLYFMSKLRYFEMKLFLLRLLVDQWSLSGQGRSIMFNLTRISDAVG